MAITIIRSIAGVTGVMPRVITPEVVFIDGLFCALVLLSLAVLLDTIKCR